MKKLLFILIAFSLTTCSSDKKLYSGRKYTPTKEQAHTEIPKNNIRGYEYSPQTTEHTTITEVCSKEKIALEKTTFNTTQGAKIRAEISKALEHRPVLRNVVLNKIEKIEKEILKQKQKHPETEMTGAIDEEAQDELETIDGLSIASLVCSTAGALVVSILGPIAGIILGIVALSKLKKLEERGIHVPRMNRYRRRSIAGIASGAGCLVLIILFILLIIASMAV